MAAQQFRENRPTLAASRNTVSLICLTPLRITARATPETHGLSQKIS